VLPVIFFCCIFHSPIELTLTVRIGCAYYPAELLTEIELNDADDLMYQVKQDCKNQVVARDILMENGVTLTA